jgi:1,4-dihydroxy-2-naphthoyl-CoA hydrolase
MSEPDDDLLATINQLDGWAREMGLVVTVANADEVVAHFDIAPQHLQAYGIVHGGVHCGVVETLTSIGAAMVALPRGQRVVGLENSTSFIRAVRSGRLHATAKPVTRGRKSQVWEAWIRDDAGQLVAEGRVRLLCLEPEQAL